MILKVSTLAERGNIKLLTLAESLPPTLNGNPEIPQEYASLSRFLTFANSVNVSPFNLRGEAYLNSGWKSLLDKGVGGTALVFSLPIFALAYLTVKIKDPSLPAVITQQRNGKDWRPFGMFKIRSQDVDTSKLGEISPTKLGSLLRKSSIDELPQIWNVLKGDMSIVGQRPTLDIDLIKFEEWAKIHLPYELAKRHIGFTDREWQSADFPVEKREQVKLYADCVREASYTLWQSWIESNPGKPGITGLHQIMGRRELPHHERMRLDLVYRQNASLLLDLYILCNTPRAVLGQRGAR